MRSIYFECNQVSYKYKPRFIINCKLDIIIFMNYRQKFLIVYTNSKFKCAICNKAIKEDDLHIDHILPKSRYPKYCESLWNLQATCSQCNMSKSDKTGWFTLKYLINNYIRNNFWKLLSFILFGYLIVSWVIFYVILTRK